MTNQIISSTKLEEYQKLYNRLTSIDNRIYCYHLLKTYGIQIAINYARLILRFKPSPVSLVRKTKTIHPSKKHGNKHQR